MGKKRRRKPSPREAFLRDLRRHVRECMKLGLAELLPKDGRPVVLASKQVGDQVFVLEASRSVKAPAKRKRRKPK